MLEKEPPSRNTPESSEPSPTSATAILIWYCSPQYTACLAVSTVVSPSNWILTVPAVLSIKKVQLLQGPVVGNPAGEKPLFTLLMLIGVVLAGIRAILVNGSGDVVPPLRKNPNTSLK